MSNYILDAKDLTKTYEENDGKIAALSQFNLQVAKGKFVSIMGPSGSGKTTLLNILGCLDKPTSGQFMLDGLDITKMKEEELPKIRAEKVGFIFQKFNLIPTLTALENVARARAKTGLEIVKLLGKLSFEEQRTIILVTHDKKMASLSHQMMFLKDGKLLKGEKKGTLETEHMDEFTCPKCGGDISPDFVLCPYCGTKLK